MLFTKTGFPEEGELVLCTVTAVQANSVFVRIDEYGGRSGMIHISEIAPGRIRNIRDFVREDKKIVCVVLRIHEEKGHIDLSLRRVNEGQKKRKVEQIKQLQKAEKIVEFVAGNNKTETKKLYFDIMDAVKKDYSDLVSLFSDVVNEGLTLDTYKIKFADQLEEVVKQRIKPPEVEIEGEFNILSYDENGVEIIRNAFKDIPETIKTHYIGAGRYYIHIKARDYKAAEEILHPVRDRIIAELEEAGAQVSYIRKNKKK